MMRRSRGVPARVSPGGGVGERWNGYRTVDHVRLDRQQRAHLPQLTLLVIGQTPVDPRFVGRVGEILFMDAQALLACQSQLACRVHQRVLLMLAQPRVDQAFVEQRHIVGCGVQHRRIMVPIPRRTGVARLQTVQER